jgi:hypothetical protein
MGIDIVGKDGWLHSCGCSEVDVPEGGGRVAFANGGGDTIFEQVDVG